MKEILENEKETNINFSQIIGRDFQDINTKQQ